MPDRTRATLIGLAIGDALGAPFETKPPTDPDLIQWGRSVFNFQPSPYLNLKEGQYTDDTQMSLVLAESLALEKGHHSTAKVANAYREWARSDRPRGMGGTIRKALFNDDPEYFWWQRSGIEDSKGNGTAMRAAPLSLMNDPSKLSWAAEVDACITHRNVEPIAGSIAVAVACYELARPELSWRQMALARAIEELQKHTEESDLIGNLQMIGELKDNGGSIYDVVLALKWVDKGVPCHVVDTVTAAFACFLFTDNYATAVTQAIHLGGDTDTQGSITGALAGSFYGLEDIPLTWRRDVEDGDYIIKLEAGLRSLQPKKLIR